MKNLTALIVDDEEKARNLLEKLVTEISGMIVIAMAPGVDEAYHLILEHKPDVVFCDVEMPPHTGFDLVRMLQIAKLDPIVVFVTAYDKYAIQAFRCAAFDYLLKPVDKTDLLTTISRIKEQTTKSDFDQKVEKLFNHVNRKNRIKLNTREGYILIDPEEIIFCKADGSYTEIHLTTGSTEVSTFNLGKIEEYLSPEHFFRISRSAIININFLKEVNRKKKSCTMLIQGNEVVFDIPKKQIRELENLA